MKETTITLKHRTVSETPPAGAQAAGDPPTVPPTSDSNEASGGDNEV